MPRKLHPAHRVAPRLAGRELGELVLDGGKLGAEAVEVGEHVLQRALRVGVVQALATHPRDVPLGPGLLALAEDQAIAQQLLADAVARRGARAAQVIEAADQVSDRDS